MSGVLIYGKCIDMNIIFEGIDAVGKSTLIKELTRVLKKQKDIFNIRELSNTPLDTLLSEMLSHDPFFRSGQNFKTSIYETFLLAASFFYKQESNRIRNSEDINIYDRDIFTLMAYQSESIYSEYGEVSESFINALCNCLLFSIKDIDLLVYVYVPLETSIERIHIRDQIKLSVSQVDFLRQAKKRMEKDIRFYSQKMNVNLIELNGEIPSSQNVEILLKEIRGS